MEFLISEIRGALARGYCTERNQDKILDSDLLDDMATEVVALICKIAKDTEQYQLLVGYLNDVRLQEEEEKNDGASDSKSD